MLVLFHFYIEEFQVSKIQDDIIMILCAIHYTGIHHLSFICPCAWCPFNAANKWYTQLKQTPSGVRLWLWFLRFQQGDSRKNIPFIGNIRQCKTVSKNRDDQEGKCPFIHHWRRGSFVFTLKWEAIHWGKHPHTWLERHPGLNLNTIYSS